MTHGEGRCDDTDRHQLIEALTDAGKLLSGFLCPNLRAQNTFKDIVTAFRHPSRAEVLKLGSVARRAVSTGRTAGPPGPMPRREPDHETDLATYD